MGRMRIFAPKPGAYGVGVQCLVEKSGGGDSPEKIASLYTANVEYGEGDNQRGVANGPILRANLRSVGRRVLTFVESLRGARQDDTYQFVGSLRAAI